MLPLIMMLLLAFVVLIVSNDSFMKNCMGKLRLPRESIIKSLNNLNIKNDLAINVFEAAQAAHSASTPSFHGTHFLSPLQFENVRNLFQVPHTFKSSHVSCVIICLSRTLLDSRCQIVEVLQTHRDYEQYFHGRKLIHKLKLRRWNPKISSVQLASTAISCSKN